MVQQIEYNIRLLNPVLRFFKKTMNFFQMFETV